MPKTPATFTTTFHYNDSSTNSNTDDTLNANITSLQVLPKLSPELIFSSEQFSDHQNMYSHDDLRIKDSLISVPLKPKGKIIQIQPKNCKPNIVHSNGLVRLICEICKTLISTQKGFYDHIVKCQKNY